MTQNTLEGIPVFNTLFMVFPNMAHSTLPQMGVAHQISSYHGDNGGEGTHTGQCILRQTACQIRHQRIELR